MGAYETNRLRLAQEAVDATASAYANDAGVDIEQRLTVELAERGIEPAIGNAVIEDLSNAIRAGHTIELQSDQIASGSPGSDNGGG